MTLEKDIVVAQAAVQNAKDRLRHVRDMAASGYLSELEVEEGQFGVKQAELSLQLIRRNWMSSRISLIRKNYKLSKAI